MKKLGLIGGTGPESTIAYYRELTSGVQAELGSQLLPPLTIESLSVFEVLDYCARNDLDGLTEYLALAIHRLHAAGAEIASLTALTPHIVFDRLRLASPIPLVSAVDVTRDAVQGIGAASVALLGTEFTMTRDFFSRPLQEAGIEVSVPSDDEIAYIQHKIVSELEFGVVVDDTRANFVAIIERMRRDHGAERVILGCTELPLILDDEVSPIPCIDPVVEHTRALVAAIVAD